MRTPFRRPRAMDIEEMRPSCCDHASPSDAMRRTRSNAARVGFGLIAAVAMLASTGAPSALAAGKGVAWAIESVAQPTNFQASDKIDQYTVTISNIGAVSSSGTITVVDHLPAGVTTSATPFGNEGGWECLPEGAGQSVVTCTSSETVRNLAHARAIFIPVATTAVSGTVENVVEVSGGGAPECGGSGQPVCPSDTTPTPIGSTSSPFGLLTLRASALDGTGATDTVAGDHPDALFTSFDVPSVNTLTLGGQRDALPVEDIRQIVFDLPAGIVGNPQATPTCSLTDLTNFGNCAHSTQVGTLELIEPHITQPGVERALPIYSIVPEQGYPAEFGVFDPLLGRSVVMYASVRTGTDYGLRVTSAPLPRALPISGVRAIFFGDPAAHDESGGSPIAMFTNPMDCGPAFTTELHVDSWQNPGPLDANGAPVLSDPRWKAAKTESPPVVGCGALQFSPEAQITPDTSVAESPSGLSVDIKVPQNEAPEGLGTPELKNVVVQLPRGMAISPSAANGLEACTNTPEPGRPEGQIALHSVEAERCPEASKIGTVELVSPAVKLPLKGSLFVAQQTANPFGALLAVYLVAEGSGVLVKLAGHVEADPLTGQLTTRFEGNPPFEGEPQQQVSEIKLGVFGGPRAPLVTPPACGSYTIDTSLTPWSSPLASVLTSGFGISSGCGRGFAPSLVAGTKNNQAAGSSSFSVTFSRADGEQRFGGVAITSPPGLEAVVKSVVQCPEPAATTGACGPESQIGEVTVSAGPGEAPVWVHGGKAFLTGPYGGAPFGLTMVVPAVAGPFNLGTEIVRARITVDPRTAQFTVTSNPLPTILQGIPLDIRTVNVNINRPGFVINPTDCQPSSVTGTISSTEGASSPVSSPFEAANCATLPFKPSLSASTQGKTSKAAGASLQVKVTSGAGQANIGKLKVDLPIQLPSRLATLHKACVDTVFNANPAACPEASLVGNAKAVSAVLAHPLTGPAYLVSHGSVELPDLVFVLQGEGVTILLDGKTHIKHGVTSESFEAVPDARISSFESTFGEGPHSVLAANLPLKAKQSMCGQTLKMPTLITGQNGAVLKQTTAIKVTGCPKAKKVKKSRKKHK